MKDWSLPKWFQMSWLFLLLLGTVGSARAQELQCADEFRQADTVYLEGRFDETIRLLQGCLDRATLFVEEAIPVYRLLALAHLNQGETGEAQSVITDLLVLAPDYEADPIQDPPSYVSLVTTQKEEVAGSQREVEIEEAKKETPPFVTETFAKEANPVEETPRVLDPPPMTDREEREQESSPSTPGLPSRSFIERPKSLLIAGSGALIIFAALGLAVGGPDTGGQ